MDIDPFTILVGSIPWIIQFILIRIGATGGIFQNILRTNSGYCINFSERERHIVANGLDCTDLFAPWASFLGIFVLSICSFLTSIIISNNRIISFMGLILMMSDTGFFLYDLRYSKILTLRDAFGYSLLASLVCMSYSFLAFLTSVS